MALRLIWLGKVWYWGINSETLEESGCKYKMDDKKFFDIHVESPAYDITNGRHVSVMLNVMGNIPDRSKEIKEKFGRINPTPLFHELSDIWFDVRDIVYMEVPDCSEITMNDCVWQHHYGKSNHIQIVPNSLFAIAIGKRDNLFDIIHRIVLGGP